LGRRFPSTSPSKKKVYLSGKKRAVNRRRVKKRKKRKTKKPRGKEGEKKGSASPSLRWEVPLGKKGKRERRINRIQILSLPREKKLNPLLAPTPSLLRTGPLPNSVLEKRRRVLGTKRA